MLVPAASTSCALHAHSDERRMALDHEPCLTPATLSSTTVAPIRSRRCAPTWSGAWTSCSGYGANPIMTSVREVGGAPLIPRQDVQPGAAARQIALAAGGELAH